MRRLYILVCLAVLSVGLIIWLYTFLSTGKIEIYSDRNSTITLQTAGSNPTTIKVGSGYVSATVSHGQYVVEVKNGIRSARQNIDLTGGHKTIKFTIKPVALENASPVTYENAQGLYVDSDKLIYLDNGTGELMEINRQNNVNEYIQDQPRTFQFIKWSSSAYGVAQDSNGYLYAIRNGTINALHMPFSYNGGTVGYDISQGGKIYVSYNQHVYVMGQNGSFKHIYTSTSSRPLLAASNDHVAVADEANGSTSSNPMLAVVDTKGNVIKKHLDAGILSWSPDGRYLASAGKSSVTVYDQSLNRVALVSSDYVGQITWLGNDTLIYASSDELWQYDVSTQRADLLGVMPLNNTVTSIAVDKEKSYVYITTGGQDTNDSNISRVGLNGQTPQSNVTELQNVLPLDFEACTVSLVDFAVPPMVVIDQAPGLGTINCLQQTYSEFSIAGISTGGLQFSVQTPD